MYYEYSYRYFNQPNLTEAEIQRQGAAQAELEAAKKATVNFYRYTEGDEITTRCESCFTSDEGCTGMEYIDKAGDWDECAACGAQNVPAWYHGEDTPDF